MFWAGAGDVGDLTGSRLRRSLSSFVPGWEGGLLLEVSGAGFRGMDGPLLRPLSRDVRRDNFALEVGIIGDPGPLLKPPAVALESVSLLD